MGYEKLHAVVAQTTFPSQNVQNTSRPDHFWKLRCRKSARPSQNVQNTPGSDHFWKLRCRKSARRCGAKHISKSKCTKHVSSRPLLEVEMSHAVVARSAFPSQKCKDTTCWDHFLTFRCRKSVRHCGEAHLEVKSVKNWWF